MCECGEDGEVAVECWRCGVTKCDDCACRSEIENQVCRRCEKESSDSSAVSANNEMFSAIAEIYSLNCVGGPLHIVLDDGNTDDASIRYCLETCNNHWSVIEDAKNSGRIIELVEFVANRLLAIS